MKKKRRILFLSLLLCAAGMSAQASRSLVPAMIVHGTNGSKQVVQLDATDVTDLIVLQNGQSLSVDIPETQVNCIRSITLAMVDAGNVPTSVERAENALVRSVEKVVRGGQVFIWLLTENGAILEYNIQGNQITTK